MSKTLNKHQANQLDYQGEFDEKKGFSFFSSKIQDIAPATLAVLVQCAALLAVIATVWLVSLTTYAYFNRTLSFSILILVLLQSFFSTTFSRLVGMATWWRWIHFGFPLSMWAMSNFYIPNEVYFVGFIISLSLFWTTFRSQVPFFPSRPVVWQQVAKLIPQNKSIRLIDIGSGLGDMSMHIAKVRPECQIEGIEIAPLPWIISYVRAKLRRSSAIFKMGDYHDLNFANYDVVFAYLSPAAMVALWQKASQEMQTGSLLISLEFEIPEVTPTIRIAGHGSSPMIYVWKMP